MKELAVATDAALLAGKLIKSCLGKRKKVRYKGAINIVTDVDEKAEDLIVKKLSKAFPGYGILAEERPEEKKGEAKWIIDPIDGTTNFAHGFPFFSVSIALEKKGQTVLGVVYDPMREELFTACKAKGAFLNKKRIKVSRVKDMGKSFLATGFAYDFKTTKQNNIQNFSNFLMASMAVRRAGAATLDLCYVACGRFDGFWELDLCAWDTAAGELIVREAGGKVTKADGSKFSNYGKNNIVASNGLIHKDMVNILNKNN
ncbi:MAG: inositol monophosphatase family protein [Candidatus Omnitrophota bacterium]